VLDGYIIDINVYAGGRIFTNPRGPITLDGKRFSGIYYEDYLKNKKNPSEFIMLQEALDYDSTNTYYPEDGLYELTKKQSSILMHRNVGVNTVLDLRLYTDALATLGDEPNGIFLTDLRFKQFIHRKHAPSMGLKFVNFFKVHLNATKLDSKNAVVDTAGQFSMLELFQRSKFSTELVVNVVNTWLERKTLNMAYIDIGAGFSNVDIKVPGDTVTIKVRKLFAEAGINFRNSSNIGCDFNVRLIFQYPSVDFKHTSTIPKMLRLGAEVHWYPFQDPTNRVFARINYIHGLTNPDKRNSFAQVHIGYSTLLSKAFSNK
jgi:hypothetical protein